MGKREKEKNDDDDDGVNVDEGLWEWIIVVLSGGRCGQSKYCFSVALSRLDISKSAIC